jgi:uncharacterized protein with GYD domain
LNGLEEKIENAYLSFGEYDVVGMIQMPDNTDAAALSMALMAGGAVENVWTTPLIIFQERALFYFVSFHCCIFNARAATYI